MQNSDNSQSDNQVSAFESILAQIEDKNDDESTRDMVIDDGPALNAEEPMQPTRATNLDPGPLRRPAKADDIKAWLNEGLSTGKLQVEPLAELPGQKYPPINVQGPGDRVRTSAAAVEGASSPAASRITPEAGNATPGMTEGAPLTNPMQQGQFPPQDVSQGSAMDPAKHIPVETSKAASLGTTAGEFASGLIHGTANTGKAAIDGMAGLGKAAIDGTADLGKAAIVGTSSLAAGGIAGSMKAAYGAKEDFSQYVKSKRSERLQNQLNDEGEIDEPRYDDASDLLNSRLRDRDEQANFSPETKVDELIDRATGEESPIDTRLTQVGNLLELSEEDRTDPEKVKAAYEQAPEATREQIDELETGLINDLKDRDEKLAKSLKDDPEFQAMTDDQQEAVLKAMQERLDSQEEMQSNTKKFLDALNQSGAMMNLKDMLGKMFSATKNLIGGFMKHIGARKDIAGDVGASQSTGLRQG